MYQSGELQQVLGSTPELTTTNLVIPDPGSSPGQARSGIHGCSGKMLANVTWLRVKPAMTIQAHGGQLSAIADNRLRAWTHSIEVWHAFMLE